MLSSIHKYFSKSLFSRYDGINLMLIGLAVGMGSLLPFAVVAVLLTLSFVESKE